VMAQRLGKTRFETEKLLGKALSEGLVKGAIDRTTDEFVSQDAVKQEHFVGTCPNCGGNVDTCTSPRNASRAHTANAPSPFRRTRDFRGTRPYIAHDF